MTLAKLTRIHVASFVALLLALPATAAEHTVLFIGEVTVANGNVATEIAVTDTLAGTFTYEDSTPDAQPVNTNLGFYGAGLDNISLTFSDTGGAYWSPAKSSAFFSNDLQVTDNNPDDIFRARGGTGFAPAIGGYAPAFFQLDLVDTDATIFPSDALPAPPLDFTQFEDKTFVMGFGANGSITGILHCVLFDLPLPLPQLSASSDYSLSTAITASPGGTTGTSTDYAITTNTGGSGAALSTSATYSAKTGYAGQLYDITAIDPAPAVDPAPEDATVSLASTFILDDGTALADPGATCWLPVSGPVSTINSAGLADTDPVYEPTVATVSAYRAGFTKEFDFTVADSAPDNFGAYASDDITDSWQVDFFGLPPNGSAAPAANPDGDTDDNLKEFLTGHDPTDVNDFFQFTVLDKSGSTTTFELDKMIPDRNYHLYANGDLQGAWTLLNTFTVGVETSDAMIQDNSAPAGTNYYRLELAKP